ncbi:hypothetical protein KP509_36G066300 [Ceratopteris richardii]|uniref:Pentatricopeptide repeat-containing protein n=1 Tax=Ceratopteris richardii TaxID=49495 RepID=A0A8T2QDB3_CERRI|nr:hypothetical protein KP509_36G066300 [Ceratopteris richardii]
MATGKEEKCVEPTEEMMSCSPEDRTSANDLMLTMYPDHGKKSELKILWSHIQSFNKVSARTCKVMIESLGKIGLMRKQRTLPVRLRERKEAAEELMLRIMRERLRPSAVTYRHLIFGYLKIGELDHALGYFRTARESLTYDHSQPWASAFLLVLNHVAERGNVELAENLFESYTSAGLFCSVKDFVQVMSDDGFHPNAETLVLLKQDTFSKGALFQ